MLKCSYSEARSVAHLAWSSVLRLRHHMAQSPSSRSFWLGAVFLPLSTGSLVLTVGISTAFLREVKDSPEVETQHSIDGRKKEGLG